MFDVPCYQERGPSRQGHFQKYLVVDIGQARVERRCGDNFPRLLRAHQQIFDFFLIKLEFGAGQHVLVFHYNAGVLTQAQNSGGDHPDDPGRGSIRA